MGVVGLLVCWYWCLLLWVFRGGDFLVRSVCLGVDGWLWVSGFRGFGFGWFSCALSLLAGWWAWYCGGC